MAHQQLLSFGYQQHVDAQRQANPVLTNYSDIVEAEWNFFRSEALNPLENFLSTGDHSNLKFSLKTYSDMYTRVYNLCITQVEGFQAELYQRYTTSIADYLEKDVRPKLETLKGEALLKELDLRWENHRVMVRWM
jgi:hypothetical protein